MVFETELSTYFWKAACGLDVPLGRDLVGRPEVIGEGAVGVGRLPLREERMDVLDLAVDDP